MCHGCFHVWVLNCSSHPERTRVNSAARRVPSVRDGVVGSLAYIACRTFFSSCVNRKACCVQGAGRPSATTSEQAHAGGVDGGVGKAKGRTLLCVSSSPVKRNGSRVAAGRLSPSESLSSAAGVFARAVGGRAGVLTPRRRAMSANCASADPSAAAYSSDFPEASNERGTVAASASSKERSDGSS